MSGTGQRTTGPPTRLTPIAPDQPIGVGPNGESILPTFYFAQLIQRILSYLGQPSSSSASAGATVSQQLDAMAAASGAPSFGIGAADPGLNGRLAALETLGASARRPLPPVAAALRRAFPIVQQLMAMADVSIKSPADGQVLAYNAAIRQWVNASLTDTHALGWLPGQNPNSAVVFTAPAGMIVTGITGRLEIAEGGAGTLSVVKAPSGTPVASGALLHTGSFNANGTAATNQALALVATSATLTLAPGDSIGIQTTGAWVASSGAITVALTPT